MNICGISELKVLYHHIFTKKFHQIMKTYICSDMKISIFPFGKNGATCYIILGTNDSFSDSIIFRLSDQNWQHRYCELTLLNFFFFFLLCVL